MQAVELAFILLIAPQQILLICKKEIFLWMSYRQVANPQKHTLPRKGIFLTFKSGLAVCRASIGHQHKLFHASSGLVD